MNQKYENRLGRRHQIIRMIWWMVWCVGTFCLPRSVGSGFKRALLKAFGARIDNTAVVYSSARIYYPANLVMEEYSCLAEHVDCYNVAPIKIGKYATVSQNSTLCTASHDIESPGHELIVAPITIGDKVWVAAEAFVGMGVTIGEGAVVGARAVVVKDVEPWTVVGGNPARFLKKRVIGGA